MHGDDDESGEPERGVRLTDGDGPHVFAAILAATFVPLVDLLERWRRLGVALAMLARSGRRVA